MLRRIGLLYPQRPHLHLMVALTAVLAAAAILLLVAQSAGAADLALLARGGQT